MELEQAIDNIEASIRAKCPSAEIERSENDRYDASLVVRLPKDWSVNQVYEFEEWAEKLTYDYLMDQDLDIGIEVYNLTRNEQELVKWICMRYPDVSVETLPSSGIPYRRASAMELFEEHQKRVNEQMIEISERTRKDRDFITRKYGARAA